MSFSIRLPHFMAERGIPKMTSPSNAFVDSFADLPLSSASDWRHLATSTVSHNFNSPNIQITRQSKLLAASQAFQRCRISNSFHRNNRASQVSTMFISCYCETAPLFPDFVLSIFFFLDFATAASFYFDFSQALRRRYPMPILLADTIAPCL